jgi:electron transport complex protein RnfG
MENGLDKRPDTGGWKDSNLAQAWLVLLLALCFGTALAAVQINLAGIIAANKLNETLSKVPDLIWGTEKAARLKDEQALVEILPGTVTIAKGARTVSYPVYRLSRNGQVEGWVIKSTGQGYADKIELLVGLDPRAETITGLFVLEQKETPGLGNKIITPEWRGQFSRKKTGRPLEVKKNSGQGNNPDSPAIDAITGATISSRSVTGIVNGIVGDVRGNLTTDHIQFAERKE